MTFRRDPVGVGSNQHGSLPGAEEEFPCSDWARVLGLASATGNNHRG